MKASTAALTLLFLVSAAHASPVSKVIVMLGNLEQKIVDEGTNAQKVYEEFAEWCEDRSKDLQNDVTTGQASAADSKATIEQDTSDIAALDSKIEELAAEINKDESDLKGATTIREKEAAAFAAQEKDLSETIDTIRRAIAIIDRGSSFLQAKSKESLADVLKLLVQGSTISSADAQRLTAFVQSEDSGVGAPDAATYESHSGGVLGVLGDLLEEAESQLSKARSTETADMHNFEMMEQTLTDEIKFGKKELGEAKASHAASSQSKASAQGDLGVTNKALAQDTESLADLHADCMEKASIFEDQTKSRNQELSALAEAKKVIKEASIGAEDVAYGLDQVSLLQVARGRDAPRFQALHLVRDLAEKQRSPALAQLAQRMSSMMRGDSADIFGKIKDLIRDMIDKLLNEGAADASHKAYCDKELAESHEKQEDLTAEIAKLTSKVDSLNARSAQLKDEVAGLQKDLTELARSQAEMDRIRGEEKAVFASEKQEMEDGIEGVKLGLKVLKDYYGSDKQHAAAEGTGSNIIGLLEVVESDFTKTLTELTAAEDAAAAEYNKTTKENEILKATTDQDVKYKTKEAAERDQGVSEGTSDREGENTELAAVNEYLKQLDAQCIAKPETYGERVGRRDAEIEGLKQALEILSG